MRKILVSMMLCFTLLLSGCSIGMKEVKDVYKLPDIEEKEYTVLMVDDEENIAAIEIGCFENEFELKEGDKIIVTSYRRTNTYYGIKNEDGEIISQPAFLKGVEIK